MKYVYIATARIHFTDCFGLENTRDVRHVFSNNTNALEWLGSKVEVICDFIRSSSVPSLLPTNLCEYAILNAYINRVPLN